MINFIIGVGIYNILYFIVIRVLFRGGTLGTEKKNVICTLYRRHIIHIIGIYQILNWIDGDDLNIIPNISTNNNIHVFDIFKITARLCFNRLYFGGINQVMDRKNCLNRLIPDDTSFHYIQSYIGIIAIINIYL